MTPAEINAVIAEHDRIHGPPGRAKAEQRERVLAQERQQRREQEVRNIEQQANTQANFDEWFALKFTEALLEKDGLFIGSVGQFVAGSCHKVRRELRAEYETKIAALETRIAELERQQSLEAKFFEMERRLELRTQERDEAKRGSEMIPQSQLLPEIEKLQRELDEKVAGLDGRFWKLTERVMQLETTNILEARFTKLANEARRESEIISQSELLAKIEGMQRQVDDLKSVADQDPRFRELTERVGELEKTNSLEARFATLASKVKHEPAIPQDELLAKLEGLQRQVDELKSVDDLDSGFRELTERVGALEQTSSLEARFSKFADEVKRGSELPQSELLPRILELERRFDDLKKIANQPGPQGLPGREGKLPIVKVFQKDAVYYAGDVVICDGPTYQALRDTGQNVNHADWICLARAGRNGCDGRSPNVRGTYDGREKYERLDIVALDDAAFIARRDNPGICPGDGWQLLSRQGRPGRRGETGERGPRGEKGEKGEPGATVVSWQLDRERYRVSPLMSDGKVGPMLELRGLFEQFLAEVGQ